MVTHDVAVPGGHHGHDPGVDERGDGVVDELVEGRAQGQGADHALALHGCRLGPVERVVR